MSREPIALLAEDVSTLNLATHVHPNTIKRWAAGEPTLRANATRLEEAMDAKGIERIPKDRASRRNIEAAPPSGE